jgi:hypothetical protein
MKLKDLETKEGIEYCQSEMLSDKFKAVCMSLIQNVSDFA